ncbi:hypothetical protein DICPUDRAFT_76982 [Dictyostelium purpureum]|nr:uncharacterized protein DICPUDRAFT_76982 [Dictyostelium purpureum]EGC37433.1 hypothetical protein DICPUDRAFT_76982 [Dictyostelium purpureum]|eukprot:XP_003286086.1 hypothetical protein DICPUDRAFT_76982 [Dictyostelium purpureum]
MEQMLYLTAPTILLFSNVIIKSLSSASHFNNGSILVNGTSITSWYHFVKTNLLKHYQTLIEMNDPEARVPFSRKPYGIENQVSSKSVVHILSNTRKFRIDYHYMIECIDGQFIDISTLIQKYFTNKNYD